MSSRPYAVSQIGEDREGGSESTAINPGNTVEVTLASGQRHSGVLVKQEAGVVVLQCRGWLGGVSRVVLERSAVDLMRRLSR